MIIKSDKARQIAAKHLAEHDPEMLGFLTVMARRFGKAEEIELAYEDEEHARELVLKLTAAVRAGIDGEA